MTHLSLPRVQPIGATTQPALSMRPVHTGRRFTTAAEDLQKRAGWVSTLLLERLRNAVQPPGAKDSLLRAGWFRMLLLERLRNAVQPPGSRTCADLPLEALQEVAVPKPRGMLRPRVPSHFPLLHLQVHVNHVKRGCASMHILRCSHCSV